MIIRFKYSILFIFIFISATVFAQIDTTKRQGVKAGANTMGKQPIADIGEVRGKVTDSKGNPVGYATVTLLRKDSTIVGGDLTQDNGKFNISPTGIGKFRLRIESIGAVTQFVNVEITPSANSKDVGTIKLAQSENMLKTVEVTAEKPIMELKVDKKVFNVEKNITSAGGSASDVLQNVPSVTVDADGNVALRGKSDVTILIDGKPATMLGTDVASALQSLPAGSIENVEVITNPSAKYDAQGTSGIINIVTKKDARFGMNGMATIGAGTRDKYNGNIGLNARKGKWTFFMNGSLRINNSYNDVTTDRTGKGSDTQSYHTFEHVPRHFNGSFNSIGATFDPNKYNSFTLTENVNVMQMGYRDASNYVVHSQNFEKDTIFNEIRYSDFAVKLLSLSTAFDYKHKFRKKDEELNIDATFVSTNINRTQDYLTYFKHDTVSEHAPGRGTNNSLNAWADYSDPLFTENGKLGLGFKSTVSWFTSGYPDGQKPMVDTINKNVQKVDTSLLATYKYNLQIHAAYVNWSDQLGKFSYQAGLRIEDAVYDGSGTVPVDTTFHNSFFNLFPSAFVSYQLGNQQSIYLNYSRRTNRPDFRSLLPFKDLSNPGTVNMGNPGLVPEFINNIEFSYSKSTKKGNNYILSAYYSYTENLNERITQRITAANDSALGLTSYVGNLLSRPVNIASGTTYGLEGTGHVQILPIWDATFNANFFQNQLIIGNSDTSISNHLSNNSGFTWFGKVNTSVKLPKGFTLQINANYESQKVIAQGNLKETYWIDVALRKRLWNNKATLVINCSDILKTHISYTNYNLATYNETINRVRETRVGNITFTYRFGKQDLGKGPKRDRIMEKNKPAEPEEKDRLKNLKEGDDGGDQGGGDRPRGGGK